MYHWLFTTVQEEIKRNFADDDEAFETAEYVSEEIWVKACLDGQFDN